MGKTTHGLGAQGDMASTVWKNTLHLQYIHLRTQLTHTLFKYQWVIHARFNCLLRIPSKEANVRLKFTITGLTAHCSSS